MKRDFRVHFSESNHKREIFVACSVEVDSRMRRFNSGRCFAGSATALIVRGWTSGWIFLCVAEGNVVKNSLPTRGIDRRTPCNYVLFTPYHAPAPSKTGRNENVKKSRQWGARLFCLRPRCIDASSIQLD